MKAILKIREEAAIVFIIQHQLKTSNDNQFIVIQQDLEVYLQNIKLIRCKVLTATRRYYVR